MQDRLVEWSCGMTVIFVSHQWLADRHPDPKGLQLAELRKAFMNLFSGELSISSAMETELFLRSFTTMSAETVTKIRSSYIWYDYWSIPQVSLAPADEREETVRDMVNAVNTIPQYVARSEFFFALCPDLVHEDTGVPCSFATWLRRGWCRLEMVSRGLCGDYAPRNDTFVLVRSGSDAIFQGALRWLGAIVGDGDFTVEEDRKLLRPVVKALMDDYTVAMAKSSDALGLAKSRYVLAIRATLLQGLGNEDHASLEESPEEEAATFLDRFGFRTLSDRGEAGLGPLHCAALEGRPRVAQAAVQAGADVNSSLGASVEELNLTEGSTALTLAGTQGHAEMVGCLLSLRADTERSDVTGSYTIHLTVLHGTMMSSCFHHDKVLELLLQHRANIESAPFIGARPLCATCGTGTNTKSMEKLLSHGASVNWTSHMGGPLHNVALWGQGTAEAVDLLVKYAADVNAVVQPPDASSRLFLSCAHWASSLGRTSELWQVLQALEGATPLLAAALRGHKELCEALLARRADQSCRNARGQSALDIARMRGNAHVAALFK